MNEKINYDEQIREAEAKLTELKQQKQAAAEAEKRALSDAKREEAGVVNAAIDKYEEAKVICNQTIKEAYKAYQAAVEEAQKKLSEVHAVADKELSKFLEKNGSFHYTYGSNDGKTVRDYSYSNQVYNTFDNFDKFVSAIQKLWF